MEAMKDSNPDEPIKGKLNITTVFLPKLVRVGTFKCQIYKEVCHSEKERSTQHKDKHGPLTCAVCNESLIHQAVFTDINTITQI